MPKNKIKVGDRVHLSMTLQAKESLNAMGLKPRWAGAKVEITQKAPAGVSFKFMQDIIKVGPDVAKEYHVGADHVDNIFHS